MDQLANNALIAGILSSILPIEDTSLKMQVGLLGSQTINYLLSQYNFNIFSYFKKKNTKLIIQNKYNDIPNPIYYQLEDYIINKYITEIKNLQLIPKNGEISFSSLNDGNKNLDDIYEKDKIQLVLNNNQDSSNKDKSKENNINSIEINADKIPLEKLKKYVEYVCNLNKPSSSIISIYKIKVTSYEKKDIVDWESVYVKTNKNYKNTIVSDEINEKLFEDVKKFLSNEEWYSNKGIPYKKGYLLYGPPGTGKTSIIKAIANTEKLPIFNLDLSSIKNNVQMLKLVTDINYLSKNKKYIVSIEDIDRCPLFSKSWEDQRLLVGNTLTIDCFLNVLDGIIETHGRIIFLSANNTDIFDRIKDVLFRPGRIDQQLHINYCNPDQINKIISNFYEIDKELVKNKINIINQSIFSNITPANVIKILQEHKNFDELFNFLNKGNDNFINTDENLNNIKNNIKKTPIQKLAEKKKKIVCDLKKNRKDYSNIDKRIESFNKQKNSLEQKINQNNIDLDKINTKIKDFNIKNKKMKK